MKDKNYDRNDKEDKDGKGNSSNPKSNSKGNKNKKNKNKNKNKNKQNKNNQNSAQKPEGTNSNEGLSDDTNDVSWYSGKYKELYDTLGVPTSFIPQGGVITVFDDYATAENIPGYRNFCEPGILTYDVVPVLPKDSNSGINQQILEYYTKIYSVSTAANSFQAADLYQYMICLASAYAVYVTFARVYGSMMSYSALNLYSPEQIVTAMGFDYGTLSKDLPSFRYELTKLCNALRKFVVPKDITLFDRWLYLANNVFVDRDAKDPRAKLFMYRLTGYYTYGEGNTPSAMYRDFEFENSAVRHDLSWMRAVIDQIIDNLNRAESIQYMNALLLKAIGDTRFEIAAVGENYQVVPIYDRAALLQAHNAMIHNELINFREYDIDQDPARNTIIQDIKGFVEYTTDNVASRAYDRLTAPYTLIDVWDKNVVEKDDIMEATRFIPLIGYSTDGTKLSFELHSCGSEIIRAAKVWYYKGTSFSDREYTWDLYGVVTVDAPNVYNWTTFNHFPMINIGLLERVPILIADHDVYAQLPNAELAKYHYVSSFNQMAIELPSGSGMLYK